MGAMLMTGCGGSGGTSEVTDIQQNVTVGKRVFVDDSGIVFFGYRNLICTAKMEGTEISEFIPEGGTTGDIYAMAVHNDELYISASDGFFKYPLSMFTSGEKKGSATTVMKDNLERFNHFEIFEDKIFFTYGHALYYVPTSGGDKTEVEDEVRDFEVSDRGIYVVETDGEMKVISPDLDDDKDLGKIAKDVNMTVGGAALYYRDGDDIKAFSVEKEESSDVGNKSAAYEYYVPWSNGTNVMYSDADFGCHLVTSGGEKDMGKCFGYPDKASGYVAGDHLVSITDDCSEMWVFDLANAEMKSYNLKEELAEYLDKTGGGNDGRDSDPEPQTSTGDYDIEKGGMKQASDDGSIVYIYFNDFMMIMPNNDKYSYVAEGDSVTFYLWAAQQEGYGGRLVTIKAYDMDDDSYKNIPSYHVAGVGKNVNKRFIAIYPTDVQWNHDDAAQEADYKDLQTYLQKIGEGAVNSPLKTADSD